jgi:MFS family permease
MTPGADFRSEFRWLSSGFLLTLYSGFGQTYFIAIFAGELKAELEISDGEFGSLYALGTLASAALLTWAGKLADAISIRWLGAGVIAGLAATSFAMAAVQTPVVLAFVLFGLRFFGQGMLTHTAMTAMGRWFNRKRGRAVSIAGLGLPASEGLLPPLAVAAAAIIGWRETWTVAAAVLLLIAAPAFLVLLKHERHPTLGPMSAANAEAVEERHQWTRAEVLRHPLFYALIPGVLAPAFIITAVFFNQVTLVEMKGWPLSWFAATFPLLAGVHIVSALATGWLIDRFGARRLLSVFLMPLGLAAAALAFANSPYVLIAVMTLIGFTLGCGSATTGALWAELYGTVHLGAIRSMTTAAVVLSTAVAPGLVGVLLDRGVAFDGQLLVMALYCFLSALWMLALVPRLDRLANA